MIAFSIQIGDHPVSFPELDVLQLESSSLSTSETASEKTAIMGGSCAAKASIFVLLDDLGELMYP